MMHTKGFDFTLLFLSLAIFCIGLLFLYSATHTEGHVFERNLVLRQAVWMFVALILLVLIISFDYQIYIDFGYIIYALSLIFLILVLFVGRTRFGAQRWFNLGMFTFQPSEFAKPALILVLASVMGGRRTDYMRLSTFITCIFLTLVPACLIAIEPDLGTSIVFVAILASMLYVGRAELKHLLIMGIGALSLCPVLWHFLRDYQKQRLLVFLNPNVDPLGAGYTIIQSKIAIGSGSLLGKGWLSGTQNQLNFLPERHSDFIFSVVGEEWGFIGSIFLVLLYLMLIKRAVSIIPRTNDLYGRLIVTGVVSMLTFQIVVNIAMTLGLMPVVGLPLPLISYGGSSLITVTSSIALLLNVSIRRTLF
jgi:rod shape determining protein RodA